jgi:hypothetical protein
MLRIALHAAVECRCHAEYAVLLLLLTKAVTRSHCSIPELHTNSCSQSMLLKKNYLVESGSNELVSKQI